MMQQLTVTFPPSQTQAYDILIGKNLLPNLSQIFPLSEYSKIVILTDENVARRWRAGLMKNLPPETSSIILPHGEQTKNLESMQIIWKHLYDQGCDRKSLLLNLGGGVIGDIGGFAASTYMRGIDFVNIPTSILAQVDESVGGKTMIDFLGVKNLIGTFYQPKAVIIDVTTLETLPERQLNAGFAEIIKHGLIADKDYFQKVTAKPPISFTEIELTDIIKRSCEIKRDVVQKDQRESGLRKIVNFGHTIGHALEAMSFANDKPLLHGEAVSIGMVAEAKLSNLKQLLSDEELQTIITSLEQAKLPVSRSGFDHQTVREIMQQDKKNVGGKISWTLLQQIGQGIINQEATPEQVSQALAFIDHE